MILSFTLYIILVASGGTSDPFHPFRWLLGTWKLENKNTYEVWKLTADEKMLRGKFFVVEGADTVVEEEISLIKNGTKYFYIPDVVGDQMSIEFEITSYTSNSFVAENARHDFPKIIRYTRKDDDNGKKLEAVIEGDGKEIIYRFNKVN